MIYSICLETIKVSSDKAQDPVKLKALDESKELYVTPARDSNALYTKINCASDVEAEIKKKAIRTQFLNEYGTDIGNFKLEKFQYK